jgi:hypothetical protein
MIGPSCCPERVGPDERPTDTEPFHLVRLSALLT